MSIDIYQLLSLNPLRKCQTKRCGFGNNVVYPFGVTTMNCVDKLKNMLALRFYVTDFFDTFNLRRKGLFYVEFIEGCRHCNT